MMVSIIQCMFITIVNFWIDTRATTLLCHFVKTKIGEVCLQEKFFKELGKQSHSMGRAPADRQNLGSGIFAKGFCEWEQKYSYREENGFAVQANFAYR